MAPVKEAEKKTAKDAPSSIPNQQYKPSPIPSDNYRRGPVQSPSGEYMTTGLVGLLLVLGLLNYYYDYSIGFERTAFANSFDVGIYVFFTFYFLIFKRAGNTSAMILLPYFFLEFAVPFIANGIASFVNYDIILKSLGVLLVMPWWLIGCFFFNSEITDRSNLQYKIINACMYIFVIYIIVVFMIPAIIAATITAPTGIVNTAAINEAKTIISNGWTDFKTSISKLYEFQRCALLETQKVCEERVYHQESIQRVVRENPLQELTTFKMDVVNFFSGGKIPSNNIIRNYVPVDSKVEGAVLDYSCGFRGAKDSGTPSPEDLQVGKTRLTATQNSVSCLLDRSKLPKTAIYYYFNVTASQIISSGYKEVMLVGENYKELILNRVPGADQDIRLENDALRNSVELGDLIKKRESESLFGPAVGEEDLARPILQDGFASGVGTELPLVYGVKENSKFDFAVFVKNNGPGRIKKISSIHVIPDIDMRLEPDNCGIGPELIQTLNTNLSVAKGEIFQVTSCQFVTTKDLEAPNEVNIRTVKVNMVYDYVISKEVAVSK